MAIKTKTLRWIASTAPDVEGYYIYIQSVPDSVTQDSQQYDVGNVTEIILNTLLGDVDGTYNIGVSAYDDVKNEGPMAIIENIPLDFVAPDAPTGLEVF